MARVLLIGWDAADWKLISSLVDAGQMPRMAALIDRGVVGNLATLRPALSPILWNSIATGKRPAQHGILGFIEPTPEGASVRPVTSTSRKTKAIWNILSDAGKQTHVVGWYASHPAERINGVCVSNQFAEASGQATTTWPMAVGSVYPETLRPAIADLRVHPSEISGADLQAMIPRLYDIDAAIDQRPAKLAAIMARNASVHAVTTAILENEPWDFVAAYYDAIDLAGHYFMPFHPPKMDKVDAGEFEFYRDVMTNVYRWHDMMLGRLLDLVDEQTTVMLVSDHGFHSDHLRPASARADSEEDAAAWHRQYGVLVAAGPRLKRDERIYGATLLDVAPTVLAAMSLPIGRDMEGKPLVQLFEQRPTLQFIPSWDSVQGTSGPINPEEVAFEPVAVAEAMKQLVELGYLAAPSGEQINPVELASREWQYNLAVSHLDAGQPQKALPIVESLFERYPASVRLGVLLVQILGTLDQHQRCLEQIERLRADHLHSPELDLWHGWALLASGRGDEAMEAIVRAEKHDSSSRAAQVMIGRIYLRQRLWPDAERAFQQALQIDPDSEMAHDGLASVYLGQGQYAKAVEHALAAVQLMHHFPIAHVRLGVALARLDDLPRAIQALQTALSINAGLLDAHRYLAAIYAKQGNLEQALHHRRVARKLWDAREQQRQSAERT